MTTDTHSNQEETLCSPPLQKLFRIIAPLLAGLGLALPSLKSQTRSSFVVHLYVDPIYGDDSLAALYNPQPSGSRLPLMAHRTSNTPINGWLQHAPYAFKTVTMAVQWINSFRLSPTTPILPWTNTQTSKTMDKIVIHCLPGLYGPKTKTGVDIDSASGLPWNGETFPIELPNRVSIQGTSALDTIFDGRGDEGLTNYIFYIKADPYSATPSFERCMIDSITIRNAVGSDQKKAPYGAGIYLETTEEPVRLVISNCFITNNDVGVALGAANGTGNYLLPILVNDTIAWNKIGIWSGQNLPQTNSFLNIGIAYPRIFNCIIDANGPGMNGGLSCFEGLHSEDLLAKAGPTGTLLCYNAWDGPITTQNPYGFANRGVAAPGWPTTSVRSNPGYNSAIQTFIDISSITQSGTSNPRGILYINDLLRSSQGQSYSAHDFRLAPFTSPAPTPPLAGNFNLCANQGLNSLPVYFASTNYPPITTFPPGLSGPGTGYDTQFAAMNAWDWDGEGFGNPRDIFLSGWPAPPQNRTTIDLGADEIDSLIMAGFIFKTRIFSRNVPSGPQIDRTPIYFVDAPNVQNRPRPQYTGFYGQDFVPGINNTWWPQAQTNPLGPGAWGNYTHGGLGCPRQQFITNQGFRYFMRNLQCDFSPHLITDPHPFWVNWFNTEFVYPNSPTDVQGSSPWFDNPDLVVNSQPPGLASPDNWNLYYNPTGGGGTARPAAAVYEGTLNPPGTWLNVPGLPGASYFYPSIPVIPFGPYSGGGTNNYWLFRVSGGDGLIRGACPTLLCGNRWHG